MGLKLIAASVIIFSVLNPLQIIETESEYRVLNIAEAAWIQNSPIAVWVTAYSSTPEETDDSPFLTASGKNVRDGVVAANFLPFGTRIIIPEFFGGKIFVVEDRMHRRKVNFVDIWMPEKEIAKKFGIKQAKIYILENSLFEN